MAYDKITVEKEILVAPELAFIVGVVLANTGVSSDSDGKKIVKAGTPIKGSLLTRTTAWTISGSEDTPSAVLLHDTDVTNGNANTTAVVFGFIDVDKLDSTVNSLLTTASTNLPKITLISGGK